MNQFDFSRIKVLIADAAQISGKTTRDVLHNCGLIDFTLTHDLAQTRAALEKTSFDLFVSNSHFENEDITELLYDIRQGDLGEQLFLPIIVLVKEPSVENVERMLGGGVDILLSLPLSTLKLSKALENLVMRRKPFVVTSDYIGPDRRMGQRPGTHQAQMTIVPNPLKRKATGKDAASSSQEEILKSIYDQRVKSYISHITFAIGKISGLTGGHEIGTMESWLEELKLTAIDLTQRINDTSYVSQSALCRSLCDVTSELKDGKTITAADLEVLQQIALALEIAIKQDSYDTAQTALNIKKIMGRSNNQGASEHISETVSATPSRSDATAN